MTTLQDLLNYLPDNSTGAIDASDLRAVVTALWEEGAAIEARTTALELDDTGGATASLTGIWQANPTAGASPQGGQVTSDTGDFDTATWLRFVPTDKNNVDLTNALQAAQSIYAQQKADAGNWVRYSIQSASVEAGYVELAVTVLGDSGGTTGAAAWQDAIVVLGGIPT